jgi:putative ABC transport system permease protein
MADRSTRRSSVAPLARIAWRESRTARRRLLLYMSSISLGVAALVAIDSFAHNVTTSVRDQARFLLGGDLLLSSRQPFPDSTSRLLDSLAAAGTGVADVTSFASMALVPRTQLTRLVNVRAVSDGYPFYGEITTNPPREWSRLQQDRVVLVDAAVLASLDASIGDTLTLGLGRFVVAGTLINVPGDAGISAAVAPRVYVAEKFIPETGLLGFGARAEYETVLKLPPGVPENRFLARFHQRLTAERVRLRTIQDREENMTEAITQLASFIGIVGLVALLLGGIGVASGIHAFVMRKIDTVAILRCLGATGRQVLAIYVVQAVVMGFIGAAAGAALGVAIQFALPRVLSDFLPVDVRVELAPLAIGLGLAIGVWVATAFALRPLVALRHVSPLQALRREPDAAALKRARRDPFRWLIALAIGASVLAIALSRAPDTIRGIAYAAGIALAVLILWSTAGLVTRVARRLTRPGWPFVFRQGLAALYRPGNQTRSVALALGFGVFLISTLYQIQSTLLDRFDRRLEESRANVVFFDIQEDQRDGVVSLMQESGVPILYEGPIVAMRIESINGQTVQEIVADSSQARRRAGWALRREYRSTYRSEPAGSEKVVEGRWFGESSPGDTIPEASLEVELARDLGIQVGDVITWSVHGRSVPVRVTSFREVEWVDFSPNFFVVFEPKALEGAPRQFVVMVHADSATSVARLQSAVVSSFPGISALDLTLMRRTISDVIRKVVTAVRFMALISLALAIPVLFSAVAATRRERLREGVLLKTLGATRRQIGRILLAEYALLGVIGSATGVVLSLLAGWALVKFVFKMSFVPALIPALVVALAMGALAVLIGLLTSREVFAETPMAALRES